MPAARALIGLLALVTLAACAPAAPSAPSAGAGESAPAARKSLTLVLNREPATIHGFAGGGSNTSRGNTEINLLHSLLVVQDANDTIRPQLAVQVPSVDLGTWRVNADGTMEMTWRLREGVRWHDGAPFTSRDLLFSFQVYKDRDIAHPYGGRMRIMGAAETPDPLTLVVRWSRIDPRATEADGLSPLPRHLLEDLYQGDKEAFINSPRFGEEYVGLGPYRMVRWERGSHMEMERFDGYYRGRPPLDGVIIRFIGDANAMAANILAGAVDLVLPPGVDLDLAMEIRRQWEGSGNQVRVGPIPWFIYLEMQYRPEMATLSQGLTNPLVRRALYQTLDREGLAEVMTHGAAPVADSWFRPNAPSRAQVEADIPKYQRDLAEAQRLLAEAGWQRGSDGVLVHGQTGERFASELWSNTRVIARGDKQLAIIAQDWRAVGVDASIYTIPASRGNDREHEAHFPMATLTTTPVTGLYARLDSREIAGPANDWSGRNKTAYRNGRVDQLLDRLTTTVDPRAKIEADRQIVRDVMGEVAFMPLYWEVRPVLALGHVVGDIHPSNAGWNAYEWDRK